MPERHNLFQDVVALVHRHLAGDALVEESAMLSNVLTGKLREVDVTITGSVAGQEVIVSVEATKGGRRATVDWVERMVGKHKNLPTNKLILVADAGFTQQARQLAVAEGAVPLEPQEGVDLEKQVIGGLTSVWAKGYQLFPESTRVTVRGTTDGDVTLDDAPRDFLVVSPDGKARFTLAGLVHGLLTASSERAREPLNLRDVATDSEGEFAYSVERPMAKVNGEETRVGLRYDEAGGSFEVHLIEHLEVKGRFEITVREVPLTHVRMGDTPAAYGQGELLGRPSILVVTKSTDGEVATVRIRDPAVAEPQDYRLN